MRLACLLGIVAAAVLTTNAGATTVGSGYFKTPSGKIFCGWVTGGTPSATVFCGELQTLHPPIPKSVDPAACRSLDYVGNRISLSVTGHAQLIPCSGDAGPFGDPSAAVYLRYGKPWSAPGLKCTAARNGLTCKNRSRHGLHINLHSWKTF